jgi:hypothetical protein
VHPSTNLVKPTKKKKALFYLVYLVVLAIVFVACAEVVLRSKGIRPWKKYDVPIQVEPGGKFFQKHTTLGYAHIPGRFTVTLGSGYSFKVAHLSNTLRITHPIEDNKEPNQKGEIWIFGGSFTHGWSINDEETFPWLLQEQFPEYEVVNFGVSGYGTIHSLIQFQEALETKAPEIFILAYAGFHDKRNTFSRARRKDVAPWNRLGPLIQPYARLDKDGELNYLIGDVEYREIPMMEYLAFAHFIEITYNQLETNWLQSHAVSEALVMEMAELAKKHEAKFIVANIIGGDAMLDFAEKSEIANIDISVDVSLPENNNLPHDPHPSAFANQKYADKLSRFLKAEFGE